MTTTQEYIAQKMKDLKNGLKKGIEQGTKQGMKQGIKQEKIKIAIEMLKLKVPMDKIEKATGLSKKDIEKLI